MISLKHKAQFKTSAETRSFASLARKAIIAATTGNGKQASRQTVGGWTHRKRRHGQTNGWMAAKTDELIDTIAPTPARVLIEVDGFGTSVLAAPGGQNRLFRPFYL